MRIAWWRPQEQAEPRVEQPYLELPSPYDYMPIEPPKEDAEEEDAPRVIIIEM